VIFFRGQITDSNLNLKRRTQLARPNYSHLQFTFKVFFLSILSASSLTAPRDKLSRTGSVLKTFSKAEEEAKITGWASARETGAAAMDHNQFLLRDATTVDNWLWRSFSPAAHSISAGKKKSLNSLTTTTKSTNAAEF
jgi:hypothetical protein